MTQFDVYISWSSPDDQLVIADLCDFLKRNGLRVHAEFIPMATASTDDERSSVDFDTDALFASILTNVLKNSMTKSSTVYRFT